ncbi:MBL fold metallo-hydrolase [Psychroserpens sp. MEBiC05023]
MKYYKTILLIACILVVSCKNDTKDPIDKDIETNTKDLVAETTSKEKTLSIHPISHATMVLTYAEEAIYVDPTGGTDAFKGFATPDIILITDIHGDHYNIETLQALDVSSSTVIAPKAVVDKFPESFKPKRISIINNNEIVEINDISFKAIPMYNLREEALQYHPKGRGNGYVLTIGSERIYISGDTEDIPEMRALENIDKAFICMNLPWTMAVDKAAEAVIEFKPKTVYPYHYRGKDGMSDVEKFKTLVNQGDESIEVVQLDWYK